MCSGRIVRGSSLFLLASHQIFFQRYISNLCQRHSVKLCSNNIIMSQKSILSFFKSTPRNATEIPKEKGTSGENVNETKPQTNGEVKKPSKRERLDSSSSESISTKEDSPIKLKKQSTKAKRQRIESSSSESGVPEEAETNTSPKSKKDMPAASVNKSPSPKSLNSVKKSKSPIEKIVPSSKKENGIDNKDELEAKKGLGLEDSKNITPELKYDPTKAKYDPVEDACWGKGKPVPYLALAKTLEAIERTSARLKIIQILSNYFRSVIALTPEDLLPSIYLCLNRLAPAYHSLELGIAETYLMKAVGQCTGRSLAQVRAGVEREGDLGALAERARASQRTMFAVPALSLRKLFAALKEIALTTGQASVAKKIASIQGLFVASRDCEARYLIRSLEGKLRIGLAEQSVLQALAVACATTPPGPDGVVELDASEGMSQERFKARVEEYALLIKRTYCECPNYDKIVPVLLEHGVEALPEHCRLTPGVPLKPMLAHPSRGVRELLQRFDAADFTCEWKYDGERAQLHVPADPQHGDRPDLARAALFSRNQEDNTTKYPDVLGRLEGLLKPSVASCVLDCEAVAYDTERGQILPFQVLSTRKRKDVAAGDVKVQVCVFVFDLLYLNGKPLVREPLAARRELLRKHFNEETGVWEFAKWRDCEAGEAEAVAAFLEEAVRGSCEGLMVKALHGDRARYDIARRSHNWLKLKKDYLEGVGDTVDAVVIGGYRGRGKRSGAYGGFLLACRDTDSDEYQSLCKIGTGFSDEQLKTLSAALDAHAIPAPRSYYRFDERHAPDAWFDAHVVWEVRCADLSLSPAHRAAAGQLGGGGRGVSLRFPRFVRSRDDKRAEDATSARQIAQMYLAQDQVRNQERVDALGEDDFY